MRLLFKDFMGAVKFINRVARLAKKMDHHPDIHLTRYRHLKIVLTTHSRRQVTQKDIRMAKAINALR